tara:strand:- start:2379 stop:3875 length:1497 start_codon:yes stop_codon:yes gene_type:complete
MKKVALVSVSNKKRLITICKIFNKYNIKMISSGQSYNEIKKLGYTSKKISTVTKQKEILNGRVKTLDSKIHGGILFKRENNNHIKTIESLKIPQIDFVITNLYPFEKIVKQNSNLDKCIENIDIGGHTLIRSAIKNYKNVTVVCDINDYKIFEEELIKNNGATTLEFRKKLASKAIEMIYRYDKQIYIWFSKNVYKNNVIPLRYGENPHQKSLLYLNHNNNNFKKIQGRELSYNNINDINTAIKCLSEFKKPTSVIVKHANPCGVSSSKNILNAFVKSLESDKKSAYGGIVALNSKVNELLAKKLNRFFFEIIIAPNFSIKAIKQLSKKNTIVIKNKLDKFYFKNKEQKQVFLGLLEQDPNNILIDNKKLKCVTNKKINNKVMKELLFSFSVCKHVSSNAIVISKNQQVLGIGGGQTNRVDSIMIALKKMRENFGKINNYVVASDAFFPFIDNIRALNKKNCIAVIQPGGSKNDKKIIDEANSMGISMYFSGIRHFKH